ncbi:MAG: CapA family protein [Clostridia bacterium]|nr:CapA family protein [Clostridia bacterium]
MAKRRTKRQQAIMKRNIFISVCALALVVAIACVGFAISSVFKAIKGEDNGNNKNSSSKGSSSYNSDSGEVKKIASAKVLNMGDIILHSTVLDGAYDSSSKTYDFSAFFPLMKAYIDSANLTVANLEVTLGGTESGRYSGYPAFNAPDSLIDDLKAAGINFLLTANNHSYDTGLFGLKRTAQVLKQKDIDFIGTKETEQDPTYVIKKVNGIKIGMINYTYENYCDVEGRKSLNGNIIAKEANNLINSFSYEHINDFYVEARETVEQMEADGAEFIVFYMHWGEEYQLKQNAWQDRISQELCNAGVDIIVGGHPHVIQPIKMLYSEDSSNETVCVYSLGNAISNQRRELLSPECTTGHTEDGLVFTFTLDKYSDGTVVLAQVDVIPTWVDKYRGGAQYQYRMIPIEDPEESAQKYELSSAVLADLKESFARTEKIVSEGLSECQKKIGCKIRYSE